MQPLMDEDFVARHRRGVPGISDRDVRMALAVVFELSCDARTRREPIRVSAQNDVVVLAGTVRSWEVREAAAVAARASVRAADFCNLLRVAGDAFHGPPADNFDRLVAGVESRKEHGASLGLGRFARFALVLAFAAWLLLPSLIILVGVPVMPALLTVLAITAVAAMTRLFRSPEPGVGPLR